MLSILISPPVEIQRVGHSFGRNIKTDELFVPIMAFYLAQLHQLVMECWHRFAENQKEIAKANENNHRAHERKQSTEEAMRIEGQRRQSEVLEDDVFILLQARGFRYFEGVHFDGDSYLHHHL